MKTDKHLKRLSVLATAVGLACGGSVLAGDKADKDKDYDSQMTDTEYSQEHSPREGQNFSNESVHGQMDPLIADDVKSNKNLSKFAEAVEKAGLADALNDGTQYTVFAPTDEAFDKFNAENADLSEEELREVLRSHIVAGEVKAAQAKTLDSAKVLTGETVKIAASGDTLKVGDAKVVEADIGSENLTIHTIDTVLAANTGEDWSEAEESE